MLPWAHVTPQHKRHLDWFSHFAQLAAECLKIATSRGDLDPHGSWAHVIPKPKLHLDRFSRFCRAQYCDRQTDGQTERPRYSVYKQYAAST